MTLSNRDPQNRPDTPNPTDIDTLLDDITVGSVDDYHREVNPGVSPQVGWFYVCTEDGVEAYFAKEVDAYRFRLDLINRRLNP